MHVILLPDLILPKLTHISKVNHNKSRDRISLAPLYILIRDSTQDTHCIASGAESFIRLTPKNPKIVLSEGIVFTRVRIVEFQNEIGNRYAQVPIWPLLVLIGTL